jgi:AMP nucleosidase
MTFVACESPEAVVRRLETLYAAAAETLRNALRAYLTDGTVPDAALRAAGAFCYPAVRLTYRPAQVAPRLDRAYARLSAPGSYSVTITRPDLFRTYLLEQLEPLMRDYQPLVEVGVSDEEIPYPYVINALDGGPPADEASAELARLFPTTQLAHLGDEIADGTWGWHVSENRPLALFDARRTDFSLHRLRHYTGTPADHVQRFILFTNYQRYVDEFVACGLRTHPHRLCGHRPVAEDRCPSAFPQAACVRRTALPVEGVAIRPVQVLY